MTPSECAIYVSIIAIAAIAFWSWAVRTFPIVWPIPLLISTLLIFSMVDIRLNEDYVFNRTLPDYVMKGDKKASNHYKSNDSSVQVVIDHDLLLADDTAKETTIGALQKEILLQTLKKEHSEIEATSKHTDELFYQKFVLVGGLFALISVIFKEVFGRVAERDQRPQTNQKPKETGSASDSGYEWAFEKLIDRSFLQLCSANFVWALLAIGVIICVSIDLSDRAKMNIANGAGAWIASYIESPILNADQKTNQRCIGDWDRFQKCAATYDDAQRWCKDESNNIRKECDRDKNEYEYRKGWESFLRVEQDGLKKEISGMHHDQVGHFLFAIQYHYLTIVLYCIYIGLLFLAFPDGAYCDPRAAASPLRWLKYRIALGLFLIIQTSLFVFAVITRESSNMLEIKVIPFTPWIAGTNPLAIIYAGILGVAPTIILGSLLCRLWRGAEISFRRRTQSTKT